MRNCRNSFKVDLGKFLELPAMNLNLSVTGTRQGVIEAIGAAKPAEPQDDATPFQKYKDLAIADVTALDAKFVGVRLSFSVSIQPNQTQSNITVAGDANFAVSAAEKKATT